MPPQGQDGQGVSCESETGDAADAVSADDAFLPQRLVGAGEDVGDVDLDAGDADPGQAVGQGQARMGVGPGVEYDAVEAVLPGLFQPVDAVAFAVGLVKLQFEARGVRAEHLGHHVREVLYGAAPVDLGLAHADEAEVGAV